MRELPNTKILFLYTELAGYFVSCINHLASNKPVKVKIIRWPINDEAPFDFTFHENVEVFDKSKLSSKELNEIVNSFEPNLVFVSGWIDNEYRKIASKFRKKKIPVILGIDNPWNGNLRQKVACLISGYYLKPNYSHVWCPGTRQYEFARRLGFAENKVMLGFYSADIELFRRNENRTRSSPKTILYAGRFLKWKGVRELYQAFQELKKEQPNEWKLLMYGRGPLKSELEPTKDIEINDFVQPTELRKIMQNVEAFCLPSYQEHWGVSVHEAAAAGCSMIVSDGVGAGTAFVKSGYNGFVFKAKNKSSLKEALQKLMVISSTDLSAMGKRSIKLSEQITPETWSATLLSVLN